MKRIMEMEEEEVEFLSAVAAAESFAKRRKPNQDEAEGPYTAALKGSKSRFWQHINPLNTWQSKSRVAASAAAGSDSEKTCPCGSGPCLILTANTERNRGRMFYKCPLPQVHSPLLYYLKISSNSLWLEIQAMASGFWRRKMEAVVFSCGVTMTLPPKLITFLCLPRHLGRPCWLKAFLSM
uniref:GRF-type domain-containing protein n=1 Tax=Gossypium raimondii TaxID=29730 RepID=A0A0D2UCL8_GOSRA|nr:hypothetical protein B456_010G143700 [Gossypium raimondii]